MFQFTEGLVDQGQLILEEVFQYMFWIVLASKRKHVLVDICLQVGDH